MTLAYAEDEVVKKQEKRGVYGSGYGYGSGSGIYGSGSGIYDSGLYSGGYVQPGGKWIAMILRSYLNVN